MPKKKTPSEEGVKRKRQNRKQRRTKKRNKKEQEQKEERTRTGKNKNSQISNLSKIESNFGKSGYVESVIMRTGILEINNRETKTMEPLS